MRVVTQKQVVGFLRSRLNGWTPREQDGENIVPIETNRQRLGEGALAVISLRGEDIASDSQSSHIVDQLSLDGEDVALVDLI